jgi:hypothetical protein
MTIWKCRTVLGLVARLRAGRPNFRMDRHPTAIRNRDEPGIVQVCVEFYGIGRPIRYGTPGMPRTTWIRPTSQA